MAYMPVCYTFIIHSNGPSLSRFSCELINYNALLFSLKRKGGQQHRQVAQWEEVIKHAEKGGKLARALSEGALCTIVYSRQKARQMQSSSWRTWSCHFLVSIGPGCHIVHLGKGRGSRQTRSPHSASETPGWWGNETQSWASMSLADETHWETWLNLNWNSYMILIWRKKRNFIKHNCVLKLVTRRRTYKEEITIQHKKRHTDPYSWTWIMLTFCWNQSSVQPWCICGCCAARGSRSPKLQAGYKSCTTCICVRLWTSVCVLFVEYFVSVEEFEFWSDGELVKPACNWVSQLDQPTLVDWKRAKSVKFLGQSDGIIRGVNYVNDNIVCMLSREKLFGNENLSHRGL